MKPWITHSVGCGPSSWRQCWACTTLLRSIAVALIAQGRVDGLEAAVEPDVADIAVRHPFGDRVGRARRDPRRRSERGKDSCGSLAAASSRRTRRCSCSAATATGAARRPPSAASWRRSVTRSRCAGPDRRWPTSRRSAAAACVRSTRRGSPRAVASAPGTSGTGMGVGIHRLGDRSGARRTPRLPC